MIKAIIASLVFFVISYIGVMLVVDLFPALI